MVPLLSSSHRHFHQCFLHILPITSSEDLYESSWVEELLTPPPSFFHPYLAIGVTPPIPPSSHGHWLFPPLTSGNGPWLLLLMQTFMLAAICEWQYFLWDSRWQSVEKITLRFQQKSWLLANYFPSAGKAIHNFWFRNKQFKNFAFWRQGTEITKIEIEISRETNPRETSASQFPKKWIW